jgi:thiamine biosynthesis lipoprotein
LTSRQTIVVGLTVVGAACAAAVGLRALPRPPSSGGAGPATQSELVGTTMGTDWKVRLGRPMGATAAAKLNAELQAVLDRVDGQVSTWKPTSDLSRFNAYRGTDWFPVPPDVAAVVAEARAVSEITGGAFDVTVGPLVALWGFAPADGGGSGAAVATAGVATTGVTAPAGTATTTRAARRVPSDDAIARAKARVDYRLLESRPSPPALRKLAPDVSVDLSAVAPGYASDLVAARLDAAGIADYIVDVSSEVRARGRSPRGGPWFVGVQTPVPDTIRVLRRVALSNSALSPSGDYQNFFDEDGKRYSHEIDPRTGRPIDHPLASVAVAHPSAARADAMATALMVLGPDAGYDLASRLNLAAFFVVRKDGRFETRATSAFEPLLLPERKE